MPSDPLSVALQISAASYQQTLAESLLDAGMLRQVIDFVPYLEIREPNGDGRLERVKNFPAYTLSKRVAWGVWRRLPGMMRPRAPVAPTVWLADRLVAKWIAPSKIFHGCTALCMASLRAAKKQGAITLVEHAASHPRDWKNVEKEECLRFGVRSLDGIGNQPERLLKRMEQEFAECDRIVVPSEVAKESFAEYGYGKNSCLLRGPRGVRQRCGVSPASVGATRIASRGTVASGRSEATDGSDIERLCRLRDSAGGRSVAGTGCTVLPRIEPLCSALANRRPRAGVTGGDGFGAGGGGNGSDWVKRLHDGRQRRADSSCARCGRLGGSDLVVLSTPRGDSGDGKSSASADRPSVHA